MRDFLFMVLLPFLPCAALTTREVTGSLAACAATEPPPNTSCGIAGFLTTPARLGAPQTFNSFDECLGLCARHLVPPGTEPPPNYGCISFSYSQSSGICDLYQKTLAEQGLMPSIDSSTKYWSIECFSCSPICPQPLNINLIDNGDFEQPRIGPWKNGNAVGSPMTVQSPGFNSAKLAYCTKHACEISQMFDTCQDSFYHLGFHFKAEGQNPADAMVEALVDLTDSYFPANGEWQLFEIWFQASSANSNKLVFFFFSDGTRGKYHYSLDTVRLHRISGDFSTKPGAREMVANGGFESGQLSPWSTVQPGRSRFKVVKNGINSAYGLRFSGNVGGEGEPAILSQTLNLRVGSVYLLRHTIKKLNDAAQFGTVSIDELFPNIPATQINNGTLNFELPFRAVKSQVVLEYNFYVGDLLIDNISVKRFVEG